MAETSITVRLNGPYRIQGPVKIVDVDGNEFQAPSDKEFIALCRCGHSSTKPFCDGTHRTVGFQAETRAK